jgi:hypothetical protein
MTQQAPVGTRLKGQSVSIRVLSGNPPAPIATIDSISTFNDATALKLLEDGFLGEVTNRFDQVLDGYGGDFEMQTTSSGWVTFLLQKEAKATRADPTITFNVVRTDLYDDGTSLIWVYADVSWGECTQKDGGRAEFVKVGCNFKCSTRTVLLDQL